MRALGFCLLLMACGGPVVNEADRTGDKVAYDSLAQFSSVLRYADTSAAIHGIQKFVRDSLGPDLGHIGVGSGDDTLIDLNSDGRSDYLREWYAPAGSGLSNRVYVALADGAIGSYRPCEQLNDLGNPTFYFDSARVYGYYVGYGGGGATSFAWVGNRLDTLADIRIEGDESDGLNYIYRVRDLRKGRAYEYASAMVDLPAAFRYSEYEPLIKGGGSPPK